MLLKCPFNECFEADDGIVQQRNTMLKSLSKEPLMPPGNILF